MRVHSTSTIEAGQVKYPVTVCYFMKDAANPPVPAKEWIQKKNSKTTRNKSRNLIRNIHDNYLSVDISIVLDRVFNELSAFARSTGFESAIKVAFGDEADATAFREAWLKGDFSGFPPIEIRDQYEINGANGAFATTTGKIYLAKQFIVANSKDINILAAVVLEEYGHYLDSNLNAS